MQLGLSLSLPHKMKHCREMLWDPCWHGICAPLHAEWGPVCSQESAEQVVMCMWSIGATDQSTCTVEIKMDEAEGLKSQKIWCIALPYKGKGELAVLLCPGFPWVSWAEMKPAHCGWHSKKRWPGESLALTCLKLHIQWIRSALEYSESQRLQGDRGYLLSSSAAQTHVHYVIES